MASLRDRAASLASNSTRPSSPVPKIALGVLLLIFFVMASILHIQTSENFFLGGPKTGMEPKWGVLLQPWLFIQGNLPPVLAEAIMWGWGIELVFLVCVIGFEVAHESVAAASQIMAKVFRTGAIVLVIFDGYTDFLYGNIASGIWGQLGFALITSFVVFFFGTIGWHLVESGLREWNR